MRVQTLLLALLLACSAAHANENDDNKGKVIEKPVLADTPDKFAEQSTWIEQEMQEGGRYEFASKNDKARVHTVLGQMSNLLQRSGSVAAMDRDTQIALFNNQEEVNGILKHNDGNRLVCENRKPIGSNIPQTHCHTFAQIQTTRRNTRAGMDEFDSSRRCGKGLGPTAAGNVQAATVCASP